MIFWIGCWFVSIAPSMLHVSPTSLKRKVSIVIASNLSLFVTWFLLRRKKFNQIKKEYICVAELYENVLRERYHFRKFNSISRFELIGKKKLTRRRETLVRGLRISWSCSSARVGGRGARATVAERSFRLWSRAAWALCQRSPWIPENDSRLVQVKLFSTETRNK